MPNRSSPPAIRLRGVRQNNLKNIDLDIPLGKLSVITGLSGSGKSSLAFETLYAEGQRRYVETFSPYARQFFDRMDKPKVDSIEGIPPAIAIEQRNAVRTTRSTVGTMTEICDYMKLLWGHLARLHCRNCGKPVIRESPAAIWDEVRGETSEVLVLFELPFSEKLGLEETLGLISRQGYQRIFDAVESPEGTIAEQVLRLEEAAPRWRTSPPKRLTVVQDRIRLTHGSRARFIEACEHAYHFGKGTLKIRSVEGGFERRFSNRLHCAECDIEYRDPSPALFSFNHPLGACPRCRGFGRVISIDYNLAIPDRSLTLAEGAIRPWKTGQSAECQQDLAKACKRRGVPMNVPFRNLDPETQRWIIDGEEGYGTSPELEWPKAWYGVKGYFRWLESRTYKMHVRVLLSRYRAYTQCPDCAGRRFNSESLNYRVAVGGSALNLAQFYSRPVRECLRIVEEIASRRKREREDPVRLILEEARARLGYLVEVGLGYLTLERPTRTLSGGETARVNLTTCLGSRLVNTLFVLDEPSVGLHARDTDRLIRILQQLRDIGNTLVVVEHENAVMRAADQIVDLGPGHGESGGHLVCQGRIDDVCRSRESLTGAYLSGRKVIAAGRKREVTDETPRLIVARAAANNLKSVTAGFPLNRFVCVTGVSGSGKSTLIREVLVPLLGRHLGGVPGQAAADDGDDESPGDEMPGGGGAELFGWERVKQAVLVDQTLLGRTPRSNPAVYTGAFDDIREFFAASPEGKARGLRASSFSFNSVEGRCERCRGAGFEKIEMQFLSDVFIRCPDCQGKRYRPHLLEVRVGAEESVGDSATKTDWSIADLLEATIGDAVRFLRRFPSNRDAERAARNLEVLEKLGLDYLRVGQPINTLSGGECQRLKLARHLTESGRNPAPTLFLFDEPTTGLHFEDVRQLLDVLQSLVDQGHSVIVIEHHLDVIRSADWLIDLGPEAGEGGGSIVVEGTPSQVAACRASFTGRALRESEVKNGDPGRSDQRSRRR